MWPQSLDSTRRSATTTPPPQQWQKPAVDRLCADPGRFKARLTPGAIIGHSR
ncbi:MAG: hypothetical protein ACKN9W_12640 [Methylococcus sp.]